VQLARWNVQRRPARGILRGMADPHTPDTSHRLARGSPASERLREVDFPLTVRGYDRRAVDGFIEELRALVADLEARQTREGIVQKALDELGEQTAGILQRAHETAEEITSRSRSQADGRLSRAEREAEIVRREADEYAEKVVVDTRLLWEERQRLIDDVRQLADEVLATADDAMERVKMPEPLVISDEDADPAIAEEAPRPTLGLLDGEATPLEGADVAEPEQHDPPDSGHTVELEALPGGPEEPPEHEHD
jgi:vacuolar-type H+-ATPase subunit H